MSQHNEVSPAKLAASLSNEERLHLVSGKDFWNSEDLPEHSIPSIRMSDGPHGLRFQAGEGDHLGINESVKSTSFPTASASANTWDPVLLEEMGKAIGAEARTLGVDVVLGPGVNIKRNPLGGRNFEYFGEDPYLAGTLAAAWINGLQKQGAGASLKHFAGNNQEADRLLSDSLIDQTALHELYLEAFRIAVTTSQPETIMHSYNMVNGTYTSENAYLLDEMLRKAWGFKGMVVTDWGALNDPIASLNAGTDLEMPGDKHFFLPQLIKGLASGAVKPEVLQRAATKVIAVATKERPTAGGERTELLSKNADLAQYIEEQAAVLLRNENHVLPLNATQKVLLVGQMALDTRYQGAGSSHINPVETTPISEGFEQEGIAFDYLPGYTMDGTNSPEMLKDARETAANVDTVIAVVGLDEHAEAEGSDRKHMRLPAEQNALIEELVAVNKKVVVLLVAGSPVELPWKNRVAAILNLYLGGERVGIAAARLLRGAVNPSGHLAETYPLVYDDVPSSQVFGKNPRSVPYLESLYVGYRYYEKAGVEVAYPFGHGLSYTDFEFSDIRLSRNKISDTASERPESSVTVEVTVKNVGTSDGSSVVQVYVGDADTRRLAPTKALKGFAKVFVPAGKREQVSVELPLQAFKHWSDVDQAWVLYEGDYTVSVGQSSASIAQELTVHATGPAFPQDSSIPQWYLSPQGRPSASDFKKLSGLEAVPQTAPVAGRLTAMNTPRELSRFSHVVATFTNVMLQQKLKEANNPAGSPEEEFLKTIILDTPLIRLAQQSSGILKPAHVKLLVGLANQPVRSLLRGTKKR